MGLIVIEGLDGSGKTTQINKLNEYLLSCGRNCRLLHFPRTEGIYGELIARFLRGELGAIEQVNPYLVAMMYAGDRLDFKTELEHRLRENDVILLDRYVYSNVAYQCAKIEDKKESRVLREWILRLEFEYHGLPKPDLNIFLDVPFEFTRQLLAGNRTGNERQYLNGKIDIHEADLDFQKRVRESYLSLSDEDCFAKIDCGDHTTMLPVDQIFAKILNALNKRI